MKQDTAIRVQSRDPVHHSQKEGSLATRLLPGIFCFFLLVILDTRSIRAETLNDNLKHFISALSNRNLDSLRLLIDPNRIFVEIAPKAGSYLNQSQTLAVVESFFRSHPPISFSFILVKDEGAIGIALGTLIVVENGRSSSHKVNFGFEKDKRSHWLMSRISIR